MTTYILHVRRPGTSQIVTYKQQAESVTEAVCKTQIEHRDTNAQELPLDHVLMVATADHLEHGVS